MARLGSYIPVDGLARALILSDYHVDWSDRGPLPWSGTVRLVPDTPQGAVCYQVKEKPRQDKEFGPTEDRRSVVVVEACWEQSGLQQNDFAISRFDLGTGKTTWRRDAAELQKAIGGHVSKLHLVCGPARPCGKLPLLIIPAGTLAAATPILWTVETKTGRLAGPFRLEWDASDFVAADYPYALATADGRVVANHIYRGEKRYGQPNHLAFCELGHGRWRRTPRQRAKSHWVHFRAPPGTG